MYIADLTEILVKKKRLQGPASEWVLCLGDLSLALPLDRTVASLETKTDLALVRRQWAVERGLRIDDRRGGDPSGTSQLASLLPCVVSLAERGSIDIQEKLGTPRYAEIWRIGRFQSDLQEVYGTA